MNNITIIGNLTRDPELRTTPNGTSVCSFTVAVNRRKKTDGQVDADFFKVTAWRELAEVCAKYLAKGRKVCVIGPVSVQTYETNNGQTRATLELRADLVEFLSPKENAERTESAAVDAASGFTQVEDDDLPY